MGRVDDTVKGAGCVASCEAGLVAWWSGVGGVSGELWDFLEGEGLLLPLDSLDVGEEGRRTGCEGFDAEREGTGETGEDGLAVRGFLPLLHSSSAFLVGEDGKLTCRCNCWGCWSCRCIAR